MQQAYAIIHTYHEIIQIGLLADEDNVSVCQMAATPIELGSVNDFGSGYFYESFFKFLKEMTSNKGAPAYPTGGYYYDIDSFIRDPGRPSRYFSYVPEGRDIKEVGLYIVAYKRGYYGNLGNVPERIKSYASEQGYVFTGPIYEMYPHDEIAIDDYDRYLIQISASVKKREANMRNLLQV